MFLFLGTTPLNGSILAAQHCHRIDLSDPMAHIDPLDITQLRWDGGAYDLLAASAVCKRWRDVIAPMLHADAVSLRQAAEGIAGDLGSTVWYKHVQGIQVVGDGHRLCLFAEALKRGALASCEQLTISGEGNPPFCNRALAPFGIALGRSLRGGALARLTSLTIRTGLAEGDETQTYSSHPGINDLGCVALCDALAGGALPLLVTLELVDNGIGDPGVVALAAAAATHGVLERCKEINLENNPFKPAGGRALCRALRNGALPELERLSLDWTDLQESLIADESLADEPLMIMRGSSRREIGDDVVAELCRLLDYDVNQVSGSHGVPVYTGYPNANHADGAASSSGRGGGRPVYSRPHAGRDAEVLMDEMCTRLVDSLRKDGIVSRWETVISDPRVLRENAPCLAWLVRW